MTRPRGISRERLKLEARRSRRPLAIYAGMLAIGLAALAITLKNIAFQPWQGQREYRIAVTDARGVQPKLQDVRISGLRVGKIAASRLERGRAVLTVSIDERHGRLYRDARVRLRPQTALQDMYVDVVSRGHAAVGELDGPLPAERTQSSVDVPSVLNTFDADVRARMQTTLDELGRGLDDRGEQLRRSFVALAPFLHSAQRLTGELAKRRRVTRALVHELGLMTAELARRDRQLTGVVGRGATTLTTVARRHPRLDRLLAALPPTLEQLHGSFATLRSTLDELDPALVALRPTAARLRPGLDALRGIAQRANPALTSLRRPVAELRPLVDALAPTARSLARAFPPLRAQAPRLDRVTARLVPCELALQKFFAWTPSVFKYADANSVFPRGDVSQGTETLGGVVPTGSLRAYPSCADAGRDR